MHTNWELRIFHELPGHIEHLDSFVTGDIDGDGRIEFFTHGLWYRPDTNESGTIAEGEFHVEARLHDVDGDGKLELVTSYQAPNEDDFTVSWFKPGADLSDPWTRHIIDATGGGHDVLAADVDGDGVEELLVHGLDRNLHLYKRGADPTKAWERHPISEVFREGLAAADLTGDGRLEIVHGPEIYTCPAGGPYAGPWTRSTFAPGFREMCRVALVDITGNGRMDIVIAESEFLDGRMSWFENRTAEDPQHPWVEHELDYPVYYAHSLSAWQSEGGTTVFMGEMEKGGWNAPYNFHAQLALYRTSDEGKTWQKEPVYHGVGTHEAEAVDLDGDGELELAGKECRQMAALGQPKIQIWKRVKERSPIAGYRHRFIDQEKPATGTDILAVDLTHDGLKDVLCGRWWWKTPSWERREIPGIEQVHCAYDIDGDGVEEIIASKGVPGKSGYGTLTSELCWLKAVDAEQGQWEEHPIGTGVGDWAHGSLVAPVLPGGGLALLIGYHSAEKGDNPELFEIPEDPTQAPWPQRELADIPYGEEFLCCDMDGDGVLDLVAGPWWLENRGDGTFAPHQMAVIADAARIAIMDVNGNGRPDVVLGEEHLVVDETSGMMEFSRLIWLENPPDPKAGLWPLHQIDTVRCPHSVGIGDLDGDGELEIVVGEHDPRRTTYRTQCRTYVYKKADAAGRSWKRWTIDDRFEHHDGTKVVELERGVPVIISHGWKDNKYVHLWERRGR